MRIGVVSDTHNNLKNVRRIVELFNAAEVDRVIHTGDITQAKTIEAMGQLHAPMIGVFGNNDQERPSLAAAIERFGFEFYEPPLQLCWNDRNIIVVHDPLEFEGHLNTQAIALHGHTHRYRCEHTDGQLFFNPGECAGMMKGANAIGVVNTTDLSTELLRF